MAKARSSTVSLSLVGAGLLLGPSPAPPQSVIEEKQVWTISNRQTDRYEGIYGPVQYVNLEELVHPTGLPIHGAIRTRGILVAGPRPRVEKGGAPTPAGGASGGTVIPRRHYALTVPTDRSLMSQGGLSMSPGHVVQDAFDFEADALNMQEIEVVGTFEDAVGDDRGGPGGFWFWAYAEAPKRSSRVASRTGLLAIEDLVARPDRLAGETVKVQGQFRGKNLFGDIEGGAPSDGWVIKDGAFAVWVVGRRPKGEGWSLDPESKADTRRWVQVTGRLDRKDGQTRLKAEEVALVPAPPPTTGEP